MCIYVIGGNDSRDVVTVPDYLRTDVFEAMARFQINSDTCDRWRNVVLIHADVPIGALKVLVRIMDDFTNELQGLILEYGVEAIMFAHFLQIDDKHIYRLAHRIALLTTELDDIIKLKRLNIGILRRLILGESDETIVRAIGYDFPRSDFEIVRNLSHTLWPLIGPRYIELYDEFEFKLEDANISAIAAWSRADEEYINTRLGSNWQFNWNVKVRVIYGLLARYACNRNLNLHYNCDLLQDLLAKLSQTELEDLRKYIMQNHYSMHKSKLHNALLELC